MEDIFWFNNPKILIKQLDMLYPKKGYSTIQNLNAIVRLFILVGIIEGLFFLKVASKFIPIKPELVTNTFIQEVKNNLV